MQLIQQADCGVLIYLRQEGRGIGLFKKLQAYNLQDAGLDTVDANLELGYLADEREYDIAALILKSLGIESVRLLTNNPQKINALTALGIKVTGRIAVEITANEDNIDYLKTKADKMAHLLFAKQ
jgi:GTP cyclohydrolase II